MTSTFPQTCRMPSAALLPLSSGHAIIRAFVAHLCLAVGQIPVSFDWRSHPAKPTLLVLNGRPKVNNTLPWALLLHLFFTCWFMGTESLKTEIITESISQVQPYKDVIAGYENTYGILVSFELCLCPHVLRVYRIKPLAPCCPWHGVELEEKPSGRERRTPSCFHENLQTDWTSTCFW